MRKPVWLFATVFAASTALLAVACGDDDGPGAGTSSSSSSSSGSTSSSSSSGSTSSSSGSSGNPDGGPDAGPGDCTFATYVIGLIKNSTTNTAVPTPDLDGKCKESTSQDEFKSLFP